MYIVLKGNTHAKPNSYTENSDLFTPIETTVLKSSNCLQDKKSVDCNYIHAHLFQRNLEIIHFVWEETKKIIYFFRKEIDVLQSLQDF